MNASNIIILPFHPCYQPSFKALNEAWISQYFKMEEPDFKSLDYPQKTILDLGGKILVALIEEEVVGVCALIKMKDPIYDYELAKMAVSSAHRGQGIGESLGKAILSLARELGSKNVYLESNRKLEPAIHLYKKLGFREVIHRKSPYERADIMMEIWF